MLNKIKIFMVSAKVKIGFFGIVATEALLHLFNIPHWH